MEKVAVHHTLLLVGTLYKDKLALLRSLGATPQNSVVYSAWASDVYDEERTPEGPPGAVPRSLPFLWDVDTTGRISKTNFDPTHHHDSAEAPMTYVIIDEINLKTPDHVKAIYELCHNPTVTVLYITTSVRTLYPASRALFRNFYAVGRFQRERVFALAFPAAPVGAFTELVHWTSA